MILEELNVFLENNPQVEWAQDDDGTLYLRHSVFDKEHEKIKIEPGALANLTSEKLEQVLIGGRNVEHITRVTGYFSRISGWNKGKKGELADRHRMNIL
ncbi:MAG: hypothetical protein KJ732_05735 [Candidatus Margulisbacteria bacterium]|nr:hypothetical protein [Candidatus Margulisiibacteriota bacterium]